MDDQERAMTMRIALRAEEVRKKHIETGCQTCMDREQFKDEEVNNG
jgi:hypothetical protein